MINTSPRSYQCTLYNFTEIHFRKRKKPTIKLEFKKKIREQEGIVNGENRLKSTMRKRKLPHKEEKNLLVVYESAISGLTKIL